MIKKGGGIYETISPVINLDRIQRFARDVGGRKVDIKNALKSLSKQELLWMIKQGWLRLN